MMYVMWYYLRYVSMLLQSNLKGVVKLEAEELSRVTLIFGVFFVMYILLKVWSLCFVHAWVLTTCLSCCSYFGICLMHTTVNVIAHTKVSCNLHTFTFTCSYLYVLSSCVFFTLKCMAKKRHHLICQWWSDWHTKGLFQPYSWQLCKNRRVML